MSVDEERLDRALAELAEHASADVCGRVEFDRVEPARDILRKLVDDAVAAMRSRKDAAYLERNRLVALLCTLFPAVHCRTAIEGWSEDWHGCVYIELPTGQVSWHFHDTHAPLFAHVPEGSAQWDGHTTEQKYERVAEAVRLLTTEHWHVC